MAAKGRQVRPLLSWALSGLPGEFVRAMEPHTEADPAALLIQFLVFAGVMIGRRAGLRVGRGLHYPNLYAVLVGGTGALGRKGTSFTDVRAFFAQVDPQFVSDRIAGGMSSGEGFLNEVRDKQEKQNEKGESILVDAGVSDKRVLWYEPEFVNVLAVKGRDGNTLSSHLRSAWDGWDVLRVATKNSPLKATGAHIGLIGHITPDELGRALNEGEAYNGFANRVLFAQVQASKRLPFGGPPVPLPQLADRLRQRLAFAEHLSQPIEWAAAARPIWEGIYEGLTPVQDGIVTALASRAEAHVVRLALIYAVLDESPQILPAHVQAAAGVWRYCHDSLRVLFADSDFGSATDPFTTLLYDVIQSRPGIARSQLDREMGFPARLKLEQALVFLREEGLISQERERRPEGGRPADRYYPSRAGARASFEP
jgi:hypothetical protein